MRKIFIVLSVLVILVTSVSCLPTSSSKTSQKDIDQDTVISDLKSSVNSLKENKVSTETFNTLKNTVETLKAPAPATDVYTKAQVDAAISQAITNAVNNLKSDQSWVKGTTTPSTTTPSGTTGSVSFATNPAAIAQMISDSASESQSMYYTMKITNNTGQWQYVKPIITLSVASSYTSTICTKVRAVMSYGSCSMVGTALSTNPNPSILYDGTNNVFTVSPPLGIATGSMVIMPIGGCGGTGEFQVGSGQTIDVLIQITNFKTNDTRIWNVSNSISTRGL